MGLFGNKKEIIQSEKKENKEMVIKVLGSGCLKCNKLENATKIALKELNLNYDIEHVTDFTQIAKYGVMTTPALVFNDEVVSYGKVLTVEEVKKLLINFGK